MVSLSNHGSLPRRKAGVAKDGHVLSPGIVLGYALAAHKLGR